MSKEKLISRFKVPSNLFRSSGYDYEVKETEKKFLKKVYKELTIASKK